MYVTRQKWEDDAKKVGAVLTDKELEVCASVRGIVVGRWDKTMRFGRLKKIERAPPLRRS